MLAKASSASANITTQTFPRPNRCGDKKIIDTFVSFLHSAVTDNMGQLLHDIMVVTAVQTLVY